MSAIYENLKWWVKNYMTPKSVYFFNGKNFNINKRYEVKKIGKGKYLLE